MMSYKRGVVRAGYGDGSRGDTGGPAFESMLVRDVKYVEFEFISRSIRQFFRHATASSKNSQSTFVPCLRDLRTEWRHGERRRAGGRAACTRIASVHH